MMKDRAAIFKGNNRASGLIRKSKDAGQNVVPSKSLGGIFIHRKAACACGGGCPSCSTGTNDLKVSEPNDPAEIEADRIAESVMRMPASQFERKGSARLANPERRDSRCDGCEGDTRNTIHRRPGGGLAVPFSSSGETGAVKSNAISGGQPLDRTARRFFEPRFRMDLGGVRVHTGGFANDSARALNARAYTIGESIVFAEREYSPDTTEGKHLIAHELAHVAQQRDGKATPNIIRRQTIGTGCAVNQAALEAAWAEGTRLTSETIDTLNSVVTTIGYGNPVPQFLRTAIFNAFGNVGLEPGLTYLPELIRRYNRILGGFSSGKTLRCDPESVPSDQNECDWRSAFVVVGDSTNIFLCPGFFEEDVNVTSRGLTLLHEMAHSVLRIPHAGLPERTYPAAFFDCATPLGIEWEDAKENAFAFDLLANCLHGERPSAAVDRDAPTEAQATQGSEDARWSISASAGADVTPNAHRFASALSGIVSLRTGEYVVFNPIIGLHLLYMPSSELNQSHLAIAAADLGLRIQQPVEGFYFDVSAGGYGGFDIDPERLDPVEPTAGLTAASGLGWRFSRIELGTEARALVPEAEFDQTQFLVFGRAAVRFP